MDPFNIIYKRKLTELIKILPNTVVEEASTEAMLPKKRRGRPKKAKQAGTANATEVLSSSNLNTNQAPPNTNINNENPSIIMNEIDYAMEVMPRKVRPATALAYRQPLAHWKVNNYYNYLTFSLLSVT